MPHNTRKRLCKALTLLRDKEVTPAQRKHANMPL